MKGGGRRKARVDATTVEYSEALYETRYNKK